MVGSVGRQATLENLGVLGIVLDGVGGVDLVRPVRQCQNEAGDTHRDHDRRQDHALGERIRYLLVDRISADDGRIPVRSTNSEDQEVDGVAE